MDKYEIIFESENILYIKINENLINDYLIMVNDPEVQKGISRKAKIYTYEQELEWVKEKLNEDATIFSMIEKETNEYIGNVEIMNIIENVGEIGIAMKSIINYALNIMNLENVDLNVHKTNPRAIHCYEKVGFKRDGVGKTEEDIHMIYKKRR